MINKLKFEVTKEPIFYGFNKNKHDGYCGLVRNDNDELLSIMKNSYHPLHMKDFQSLTNNLQKVSGFELIQQQEWNGGRIVLSYLENNQGINKIGDFEMKNYMVLGNSFDGTSSIFLGSSDIVIRCMNAFGRISKQNKIRHTSSSETKISELVKSLEIFFKEKEELYLKFSEWNGRMVNSEEIEYIIRKVTNLEEKLDENSTRRLNKAETIKMAVQRETNAMGDNLWGIMNGMTYYSTHLMQKENRKNFGNIVGNQANFNNKAFKVIQELEYTT